MNAGNSFMSEARNEDRATGFGGVRLWGRYSALGLIVAAASLTADQFHKYWMIEIYKIGEQGRISVSSFLDLVMVWNPGISYGLLPQDGALGRILLIGISIIAVTALFLWMGNAATRIVAASLGLIIGGAIGNLIDRLTYGAVADFFSFHFGGFYWYVFNIADVAITVGVIGLVLDWLWPSHRKVPKSV